ncbi:MAG: hypothetical protein JW808_00110 [Victivallales bacterium]|nr:hypothetical protein [Victivallales bacterium]
MECAWKSNWEETKGNFIGWWRRDELVILARCPLPRGFVPHEQVENVPDKEVLAEYFTDARWRAARNHYEMANSHFPLDNLPIANANYGPGNLATFLGSEPEYKEETVWYYPCIADVSEPERLPPLVFDSGNKHFRIVEETLKLNADLGRGKYLTGCPDLIENIDILASLRDPQVLLMDMIERPGWVEKKVMEINRAFFDAYDRIYDIIKGDDGSSAFWAFGLWSEGKVAKVQCDASAMFSPEMFKRFVLPALEEQCEWLDNSMFHLDGHQCICHLDHLLGIEALDAIEWTPDPTVPGGGDPCWHEMYKRILSAGKSVQAIGIKFDEVQPLLDAVGTKGMYLICNVKDEKELEKLEDIVSRYR